jgi:hypothetical protein
VPADAVAEQLDLAVLDPEDLDHLAEADPDPIVELLRTAVHSLTTAE